jgi:protease IV
MARTRDIIIGSVIAAVGLIFILLVMISIWGISHQEGFSIASSGGRVAIVEVDGVITGSDDIIRQLKKYEKDKSVKAVVIHINSPGGEVAPTQEIYDQILKLKESGMPVVVSISSVAASGGYYIACAADTIFANPGSLTGSIGVIIDFLTFEGLMNKVGVQHEVVKSGELKDVGNFARAMTEKERAMMQAAINDVYNQFTETISEARNIDLAQVEELADGSIFTGNQALELGLVDKLGGLEDAIALGGKMGGLSDHPKVIREYYRRPRLIDYLTGQALDALGIKAAGNTAGPSFQYIYR